MSVIDTYFENLENLSDREKAALRHCMNRELTEANGQAMIAFNKALPAGVPREMEGVWFAVATYYPNNDGLPQYSLRKAIYLAAGIDENIRKKLVKFMAYAVDQITAKEALFYISQILRRIWQRDTGVDLKKLLEELLVWDTDREKIAHRWFHA